MAKKSKIVPLRKKHTSSESEKYVAAKDSLEGIIIDQKYRVDAAIGRGGMGVVYRGEHLLMERPIAIKVLHAHLVESQEFLRRFKQEARITSRLRHQNAILIHDFGIYDKVPYLVMEYCPGETLKEFLVGRGPLTAKTLNHYVRQICAVLAEAHSLGIIHRDLKPENIILPRDHQTKANLRVLDFGIAKLLGPSGESTNFTLATRSEMFFGTPGYASPEQVCNRALDNRSDIYALGVILYECLAGTLPFSAPSLMELILKHVHEQPKPIRQIAPQVEVNSAVEDVVAKCLEKDPANRFQSVQELAEAFDLAAFHSKSRVPGREELQRDGDSQKLSLGKSSWPKGFALSVMVVGSIALTFVYVSDAFKNKEFKTVVTPAQQSFSSNRSRPTPSPAILPTTISKEESPAKLSPAQPTVVQPSAAQIAELLGDTTDFPVFTFDTAKSPTSSSTPTSEGYKVLAEEEGVGGLIKKAEKLYIAKNYHEAIPLYETVIKKEPSQVKAQVDLGTSYLRVGRKGDALAQFQNAIKIGPRYSPAYYELACYYALENQKEEALAELEQAIRLDFRVKATAKTEPDFASLQSDFRFEQLISPSGNTREKAKNVARGRRNSVEHTIEKLGDELIRVLK